MKWVRHVIEEEGAEVVGYDRMKCNLGESSVGERNLSDIGVVIDNMEFPYAQDHYGMTELRTRLAEIQGSPATTDDIMVTTGATEALFITAVTLLENGDHVVIQQPNYSVNAMTPMTVKADVELFECSFDDGYVLDLEKLDRMVKPETKVVSFTYPINPSGKMISEEELKGIIAICEKNDAWLIMDETYREMAYDKPLPVAANLSRKAISISTLSKVYGFPGIRVGWIYTRNPDLMYIFLAAKEQICVHGSVLDEYVAFKALEKRDEWLPVVKEKILRRKDITKNWVEKQDYLSWTEPEGGCTCFVRVDEELGIDFDTFYDYLLDNYGAYPGAGNWFEFPRNYMRIGFVWPSTDEELQLGLDGIASAIHDLRKDK